MTLTNEHKQLLYQAWVINRACHGGQVLEPGAVPRAHELAEAGWLERRIQDDQGTWWWSDRAETALGLASLTEPGCQN